MRLRLSARRRMVLGLSTLVILLSISSEAMAQRRRAQGGGLPQPHLQSIFPLGVPAGETADITLRGTDLDEVRTLWFDHPGIRAFHLKDRTFRVACAPGTPVGQHDVRAFGPYGLSNPRTLVVGDRPEVVEVEPNNSPDLAQMIPLNRTVEGEIASVDVDCFAFTGLRGQRLLLELEAERLDSRLDATLRLLDSTGRELAENRDSIGGDPLLDVTLPADGRYVVKVHDVTYKGSPDHPYRLTISDRPHLDAVSPVVARPGEATTFTLYGRNLGGVPAPGVFVDGRPVERTTVTITPPSTADGDPTDPSRGWVGSRAATRRGFEISHATPSGRSQPLFVALTDDPVVLECEPNDADHAQNVSTPCDISGCFGAPGDDDVFRFRARKGEVLWVEATAERLGSAADPVFVIQKVGEKGVASDLATGDDTDIQFSAGRFDTSSVDAATRWVAPEDGTFQVVVSDLYGSQRGDVRLAYRLSIRPERPDFQLFLLPDSPTQPDAVTVGAGSRALAYVFAHRIDRFDGPIRVEPLELPPGVRCDPVVVPAGETLAPIVFEAEEGAAPGVGLVRLVGLSRFGDRKDRLDYLSGLTTLGPDRSHEANGGGMVWPRTDPQNGRPLARLTRGFILGVVGPTPLSLAIRNGPVAVTAGSQLVLDLAVTRRLGFSEEVKVAIIDQDRSLSPQAPVATIAKGATSGTFVMVVPKGTRRGTYNLVLQGTGTFPFSKDPAAKTKPNVTLSEPSNALAVRVRPSLANVAIDAKGGGLKAGATLGVTVTISPKETTPGPIVVSLSAPAGLKLTASPVTAVPGKPVTLEIKAAADSPAGAASGAAIRFTLPNLDPSVEQNEPIALTIAR